MTYEQSGILLSERIYRLLLRFYPRGYRQEFAEEMEYVFSESLKDSLRESGVLGMVSLWSRTAIDTGKTLVVQHVENLKGDGSMKPRNTNFIAQNKNILLVALATALMLLVFYVLQSGDEVGWSAGDFIFAGTFLFGTGLALELLTRKVKTWTHRAALAFALGTALFLLWSNLAVGIIETEDHPANWMYLGVLGIFILGALIVRFRPQGMVLVLTATAAAQALTVPAALIAYRNLDLFKVFGVNGFFIVLWVASALLFHRVAKTNHQ